MDNRDIKDFIRYCILLVTACLMVVTGLLQIVAYEPIRHFVMCIVIIILTNVVIWLDIHLNYKKIVLFHIGLYLIWFFNLVITLYKF